MYRGTSSAGAVAASESLALSAALGPFNPPFSSLFALCSCHVVCQLFTRQSTDGHLAVKDVRIEATASAAFDALSHGQDAAP